MGYDLNIPEVASGDAAIAMHHGEPLVLEPGKTYVVELKHVFGYEALESLRKHLAGEKARTGINFIVIGPGLKVRSLGWRDRLMNWALR
jgi:hypothetical protein